MESETRSTALTYGSSGPLRLRVPGLVIVSHPDLRRVGDEVALAELVSGSPVGLSRREPSFARPEGDAEPCPLNEPHLSRQPLRLEPGAEPGAVTLVCGSSPIEVTVRGETVLLRRAFSAAEVERGVVLVLSRRVALLLCMLEPFARADLPPSWLVGASPAITQLREEIRTAARLQVPVLVRGETGTGKELVARGLHESGPRRNGPFHAVNLGALVPALAASALFGTVRGAYTGAERTTPGFFRSSDGGTLFLDEIGEAPLEVQALLLRALETGEVQAVGSVESHAVDVRVIAATDADLETAVAEGRFRPALLHRLTGYEIRVPPLRERRDDIARLLRHFFELESQSLPDRTEGTPEIPWPPSEVVAALVEADWSGNVRQLRNVARRLLAAGLTRGPGEQERLARELLRAGGAASASRPSLFPEPAPENGLPPPRRFRRAADIGETELAEALEAHQWQIGPAAAALGISRGALYRRIELSPGIRKAADLEPAEIEAALARGGGQAAARELKVSPQGLKRRLTALYGNREDAGR